MVFGVPENSGTGLRQRSVQEQGYMCKPREYGRLQGEVCAVTLGSCDPEAYGSGGVLGVEFA